MAKARESSTDRDLYNNDEIPDIDAVKKPEWVNLTSLEGIRQDGLFDKLLYKPALRFHGLTGGLWGQGLSGSPSVITDSRPPSYKVKDPLAATYMNDTSTTYDQGSLYNTNNISAVSPVTLRRRNTVAVVLVAAALLAATAAVTGIILHLIQPQALLRANVRFTIANRNFTDDMRNSSSAEFEDVATSLCGEMDIYFLTSELSEFYFGCKVKSLRKDTHSDNVAVHYTLDFLENKLTNNKERIRNVILNKSGRHKTKDTLFLVIDEFWVHLRSLRIDLDVISMDGKRPQRPRIPWRNDIDFITRFTKFNNISDIYGMKDILKHLINSMHNMSQKLDTMQDAINFINKTLHESRKPFHKLDKTFENMTKSFDNFNRNLNDIKEILNDFKTFLQPFHDTIFNIDDVIQHIDKTVDDLDMTRAYVGISMRDLSEIVKNVTGSISDLTGSLNHINMSVFHVNSTANYTNRTVGSMEKTLESLDTAIKGMNLKLDKVLGGIDGINFSLTTINKSLQNSNNRLKGLQSRLKNMNGTTKRIKSNIQKLNETYRSINDTLESMNEPIMITEGTILQVINKLGNMDVELMNISQKMDVVGDKISLMNDSFESTVHWMSQMLRALKKLNVTVESSNETVSFGLHNLELIDTVGVLLKINSTLHNVEKRIDSNNGKIDTMERTLDGLEKNLQHLDDMLASINHTFTVLNDTLKDVNSTLFEVRQPLQSMNKNVNRINYSFEDLHETFDNINKALDLANQTIDKVSTSKYEINDTLFHVRGRLNKTQVAVKQFNFSVGSLNQSLNSMGGSMEKLKEDLYNRNESLKVLKSKVNNTVSSFQSLEGTLTGMNKTIDELLEKLKQTNEALTRTNISLKAVNNTISAIEDAWREMSDTHDTIFSLFNKTQNSLKEFRSAFPTLTEKVDDTDRDMKDVLKDIQKLNDILDENYIKRKDSAQKYDAITSLFNDVYNEVLHVKNSFQQAYDYSKSVFNEIDDLVKNVASTEKKYTGLERNINFLEKSFDDIKNRHRLIQDESRLLNDQINSADSRLHILTKQHEGILSLREHYPMLVIPQDEIKFSLENQMTSLDKAEDTLTFWDSKLKIATDNVWNTKKNPLHVHSDFDMMANNINFANTTIQQFDMHTNNVSAVLSDFFNTERDIRDLFNHIKSSTSKVDDILTASDKIGEKLLVVEGQLESNNNSLNTLETRLDDLLVTLKKLKSEFGNVNGTLDTTTLYGKIDDLINSKELQIQSLQSETRKASLLYLEAKLKHNFANESFQNTLISINKEGDEFINDTINTLMESEMILDAINDKLNLVEISKDNFNFSLQQLEQDIANIQQILQAKAKHHNFIHASRPALEKSFHDVSRTFQNADDTFNDLKQYINHLNEKAVSIDSKITGMPNIDISVEDEKDLLKNIESSLSELKREIDAASQNYIISKKHFETLNETEKDLKTVKEEYLKYKNQLDDYKRMLATVNIETSIIKKRLDHISDEFFSIENSIDNFNYYKKKLVNLGNMVELVHSNLLETTEKTAKTSETVIEANKTLHDMKEKYSNFSAASFNISELYVNEAVEELINAFNNISKDLFVTGENWESMKSSFNETNIRLHTLPLNRYNVTRFLDTEVHPKSDDILLNIENINSSLNEIKLRLREINMNTLLINNNLQIKNERLFVDEQKQLLADTKFPHLEQSINSLNILLDVLNTTLNNTYSEIHETNSLMDKVYSKVGNMSTIHLPDTTHREIMAHMEGSLINTLSSIKGTRDDLLNVNDTVWSGDGKRYSHTESVQDIHRRYQNAENNLKTIADSINGIEKNISNVRDAQTVLSGKLRTINDMLTEFDGLENNARNVSALLSDLKHYNTQTNNNLFLTGESLSLLNSRLNNTKARFSHINQTVVRNTLDPIVFNVLENRNRYENLIESASGIIYLVDKVDQLFKTLNDSKHKAVTNVSDLHDVIENVTAMVGNILPKLMSAQKQTEKLDSQIPHLENELKSINTMLDESVKDLYGQEKIEFYTNSFEEIPYDDIDSKIQQYKSRNEILNDSLINVQDELNALTESLLGTENVEIDLQNLVDNLATLNETIMKNSYNLKDLDNSHKQAFQYFYANDGNKVSDNESIEEMKARYDALNDTLQFINHNLLDVHVDENLFDILTNSSLRMKHIREKLDNFNKYSSVIKHFKERGNSLNASIKSVFNKLSDHLFNAMSLENDLFKLDSIFVGVNNTEIHKTRKLIDDMKNDIDTSLFSVKNDTESDANILSNMENVIDNTLSKYNSGIDSLVDLEVFLNDSTGVTTLIEDTLSQVNQSLKQSEETVQKLNNSLTHLKDEIVSLESLLIQQEKRNFIQANAPMIQDQLRLLEKSVNQAHKNTSSETEEAILVQGLNDIVRNKVNNNDLLSFSLDNTSTLIQNVLNGLMVKEDEIVTLNKTLNDIDRKMFDEDRKYFGNMTTLSTINNTYSDIAETIDSTKESLDIISRYNSKVGYIMNETNKYLTDLLEEINRGDKIRNQIMPLDLNNVSITQNVNALDVELKETEATIKQLNEMVNKMKTRFSNVTDPSLLHATQNIVSAIETLQGSHSKNKVDFIDTANLKTKSESDFQYLKNILDREALSFDDLKTNNILSNNLVHKLNTSFRDVNEKLKLSFNDSNLVKDAAKDLLQKLDDLEFSYTQAQMDQYVNATFPDIIENIDTLKSTLKRLSKNLKDASAMRENVSIKLQSTKVKAWDQNFDILFDDLNKFRNIIDNELPKATEKHNSLEGNLNDFVRILQKDFTSSDTLINIAKRFQTYNNTLKSLSELTFPIEQSIKKIESAYNKTIGQLNKYDKELTKYSNTTAGLYDLKDYAGNLDQLINKTVFDLNEAGLDVNFLQVQMDYIQEKFQHVNRSYLANTKDMILYSIAELQDDKKMCEDNIKHLKNSTFIMNDKLERQFSKGMQTIPNQLSLASQANDTETLRKNIESELASIDEELTAIADNNLPDINMRISQTRRAVSNLIDSYEDEEKRDYISQNLPNLLKEISSINKSLDNQRNRINGFDSRLLPLNDSLLEIEYNIKDIPNVFISLQRLRDKTATNKGNMESLLSMLETRQEDVNKIQLNKLTPDALQKLHLDEVQDVFTDIGHLLNDTKESLGFMAKTLDRTNHSLQESENKVELTKDLLSRYAKVKTHSQLIKERLHTLNQSIKDTGNAFDHLNTKFASNFTRYRSLEKEFIGIRNPDIDRLYNEAKNLSSRVNLRLPLVDELYEDKVITGYSDTLNNYKNVQHAVDSLITDFTSFKDIIENAESANFNISNDIKTLETDEHHYREESSILDTQSDQFSKLIERLEKALKRQTKREILQSDVPNLKEYLSNVTERAEVMKSVLNKTKRRAEIINLTFDSLADVLQTKPSLQISLQKTFEHLNSVKHELDKQSAILADIIKGLDDHQLHKFDSDSIIQDDMILISDLETILKNFTEPLLESDRVISSAETVKSDIDLLQTTMKHDASLLRDTLTDFDERETTLNNLYSDIVDVMAKEKAVGSRLDYVNDSLSALKSALEKTTTEFSTYNPEDRYLNNLLLENDNKIKALKKFYEETLDTLKNVRYDFDNMNSTLKYSVNDTQLLRDKINEFDHQLPSTFAQLKRVNETLDNVLSEIPVLENSLVSAEKDIHNLNDSLVRKDKKSKFIKKTLPVLKTKYEETNNTFFLVNKTFDEMENKLRNLEEFVDKVKSQMNQFENINISMSNITSDLTYLENRLIIMKQHYNNIKGIVSDLQKGLHGGMQFGDNTTLENITNTFSKYNLTIDKVDEVLGKIDMEFTEMDNHFAFMNDTLIEIDTAIDQYDNHALATKLMEREIVDLAKDLKFKDAKLYAMRETVSGLNSTFERLQDKYRDVLNTTANKNLDLRRTLLNATNLIEHLQNVILKNLHEKENAIQRNFDKMNNTLQQNISSSSYLDFVLSEVQMSYDDIVDSLDTFIQNISDAENDTGGLNTLLDGIVTLLDEINSTLHAEQIKHNFINSNQLTFEDKLLVLEEAFESTKGSLDNFDNSVTDISSLVSNVQSRMSDYPTLYFEMDEKEMNFIHKNLSDTMFKYDSMEKEFTNVKSGISSFDDRLLNMTELDSRYSEMNTTMDKMASDLFHMGSEISNRNKDTQAIAEIANRINSTLNAFTKAELDKDKIGDALDNMDVNMTSLNDNISSVSDTLDNIDDRLTIMKTEYSNVNTSSSRVLMKNLLDLSEEFREKKKEFEDIGSEFQRNSEIFMEAKDKFRNLEGLLHTSVYSLDQLQNITQNAENNISELHSQIAAADTRFGSTRSRTNLIETDLIDLKDRIRKLNESLFEEKKKEEFIADNFEHINNTFNAIQEQIEHSNSTVAQSLDRTAAVFDAISKLSVKLDRFSAINISLDSEKKHVEEEHEKLNKLLKIYNNVSDEHKRLKIADLQHTNKSFDEIREDYENFQNVLTRLKESLKNIDETVSDTNFRLGNLNTTISDINDSVDNYERMENIIHDHAETSTETNAGLNRSKHEAKELEEQIKYLNQSLVSLGSTFNQITDPSLRNAKENLEHVLQNFGEQLNNLQKENNEMESLSAGIQNRFGSINETLYSTKKMIAELKEHIHNVNHSSSLLSQDLDAMKTKQNLAQNTADDLKPGLDRILRELLNLTTTFTHEQEKMDFVAKNKPLLQAEYESLEEKFNDINKRISLTELQLADLRYLIKTVGVRLEKFDTLAITTEPEMKKWENHSSEVHDVSSRFVRLSSQYNLLKEDIFQLDYRNSSEGAIKSNFKAIDDKLQDIKSALEQKNNTIKDISAENNLIKTVLDDFSKIVSSYEELQSDGRVTKQLMESTLEAISNGYNSLKEVTDLKNTIESAIKHMQTKYESIKSKDWEQMMAGFKMDLSFEESKLKLYKANLDSVQDVMQTTTSAFNNTFKTLTDQTLNRETVRNVVSKLDRNIRNANMTFTDTDVQITEVNKDLNNVNKTLNDVWNKLRELNQTLYFEWEKAEYVKDALPKLQDKLVSVNETFTTNLPSSINLKNQISYLTVIVGKIEQKMKLYGVEDTDNAVKEWRKLIVKLNNTVQEIILQNEKSDQTLTELRSLLWSDKPMYSSSETLAEVKSRFEEFEKTLESIKTSSHSINLKLNKMGANSKEMALAMENKDMMLTTTTTPASPPDWLSFTSSGSGVIAVDKGWLECSAKDLTNWEMMTISRKSSDGKEEVMAAWKRGVGARKPRTFRDRRVRVKRILDNSGGGKLQVNINSIQCVDEATYLCAVDSHRMWPIQTEISVMSPPEDSLEPDFPTEVFEDKVANFSCTGRPGYPNGKLIWKIRRQNEAFFKDFDFYSARQKVEDKKCTRTETNTVGYQFDMKWNNTRIRCYIENTDYYGEGVIRILPYTICNNVRDLGKIRHPYTPHKYIVCDRGLNIMQCPGNTCYDQAEGNCVQCKASVVGGDPCRGQPLFSYVAHETECNKYYICMGRTKSTKTCSKGYFAKDIPGHCVLSYERSDCARKKRG